MLRKIAAVFLLTSLLCAADTRWKRRLDLERLLNDPQAMQSLVIAYTSYDNRLSLFIFGNGKIVTQPTTATTELVPTCTADIPEEQVRSLVQLFIEKRFFDLPQKDFIMLDVSPAEWAAQVEIQTIRLTDDEGIASRSFGTGWYKGEKLTLPSDFADVRDALVQLRLSALPNDGPKSCKFETQIKK